MRPKVSRAAGIGACGIMWVSHPGVGFLCLSCHRGKTTDGCGGMLLDRHSRFLLRHRLRFRAERNHGVPLPFQAQNGHDVEHALQDAITAGRARLVLRNQDVVALTRVEVRPRTGLAVLLFRRSDPNAATPIFEHQRTRRIRRADKADDEAVAVSAHVFVKLEELGGGHPTYRVIMEEVPGLGRSYIHHLIADILRNTTYLYTDRHGERKETYTVMDFHGIKSDSIGGVNGRGRCAARSIGSARPT